jgi:hypothetical protein
MTGHRSAFLLALFLFFPTQIFALESLAVSQLTASGVTKEEAASLTDALRSELGKSGKYQVMERGQMEEVLKEQGFQQSGACDETNCAVEMGKILSVRYMVLGNIGMVGKTYTLSVRIVDVQTAKILSDVTEYHKGQSDALLTKTIPVATQKLTGTYVKKQHTTWWVAGGTVVVFAAAVPIVLLTRKEPKAQGTTDVTVRWNP